MPLVELITNLRDFNYYYGGPGNFTQKKIPFGKDLPGGGSSGEPYVTFPNPDNASRDLKDYYMLNRSSLDFPIRGGSLQYLDQGILIPKAASYDGRRISRFLTSNPKGTAFILKQTGLQLSNPKLETAGGFTGITSLLGNTRTYNGGMNTLAQVRVQGSGTHLLRHGLLPFSIGEDGYVKAVEQNNKSRNGLENRLVALWQTKILGDTTSETLRNRKLNISSNSTQLFQYQGGPDSVYGIGNTTIKRYSTTVSKDTTAVEKRTYSRVGYFSHIFDQTSRNVIQGSSRVIQGYNNLISSTGSRKEYGIDTTAAAQASTYTFNYAQLAQVSGSNRNGKVQGNFVEKLLTGSEDTVKTRLNPISSSYALPAVKSRAGTGAEYNYEPLKDEINNLTVGSDSSENSDLITFKFEAIEYNGKDTPTVFRAYLTGIQDTHASEIGNFKYMGRGENFYVYNGFNRQISFNFKVAAFNREQLQIGYDKVNYLLSQVYPDYGTSGLMKTPVVRLTIGDYIKSQPGLINSLGVTIDDNVPWEIDPGAQVPTVLSISCQFTPIQDYLPRRSQGPRSITKLISI